MSLRDYRNKGVVRSMDGPGMYNLGRLPRRTASRSLSSAQKTALDKAVKEKKLAIGKLQDTGLLVSIQGAEIIDIGGGCVVLEHSPAAMNRK